jgi:hypothetical protein
MPRNVKKSILTVLCLIATVLNVAGILLAVVGIFRGISLGAFLFMTALPLLNIFCIWSPIQAVWRLIAIIFNVIFFLAVAYNQNYDVRSLPGFFIWSALPLLSIFCIWYWWMKGKERQKQVSA